MKDKTKRISAIVIAILFAISIALGIFFSTRPKIEASAEEIAIDPTENETYSRFEVKGENITTIIGQQQIYIQAENPQSTEKAGYIDIDLGIRTPTNTKIEAASFKEAKISLSYSGFKNVQTNGINKQEEFFIQFKSDNYITIADCKIPSADFNTVRITKNNITYRNNSNEETEFRYMRIYINPNTTTSTYYKSWFQIFKFKFTHPVEAGGEFNFEYESYLYDIISSPNTPSYNNAYQNGYKNGYKNGYNEGYELGKDTGYNIGYNKGYSEGNDKGIISGWKNPITIFIEPIDNFLSANIFGNISIGDIVTVVIFIMIAIIFIKMFAGG